MTTAYKELCVSPARGFTVMSLELFLRGGAPSVDVYAFVGDDPRPQMLADRTQRIDEDKIQEWMESGLRGLLVRDREVGPLIDKMESSLERLLTDENLTAEERFRMMQLVVSSSLEKRLKWGETDDWVRESLTVAVRLSGFITENVVDASSLFDALAHDLSPFTHATNVAAYLLMLAAEMGVHDEGDLRQIAQGGLLHDFGKRFLPAEMVKKNGPLKPEERRQFEKHPVMGYEALLGQPELTRGQLMMVYQHGEWFNGGGFPVAIVGDEVHPWARMLAVVDAFDTLTTDLPHRKGMSAADALIHLSAKAGVQFEPEAIQCWAALFEQASPTKSGRV